MRSGEGGFNEREVCQILRRGTLVVLENPETKVALLAGVAPAIYLPCAHIYICISRYQPPALASHSTR